MAHGTIDQQLKIYTYSLLNDNNNEVYFLIELIIDFGEFELSYTIKTNVNSWLPKYEEFFSKIIEPLL
jgi:hypothetical protein